jgi:secreted trypsin-like serine protease
MCGKLGSFNFISHKVWAVAGLVVTMGLVPTMASAQMVRPAIINGEDAVLGDLPWQILIREGDQADHNSNSCYGTLVHPNWIITAAHCFPEQSEEFTEFDISAPADLFVVAGVVDSLDTSGGVTRAVDWII